MARLSCKVSKRLLDGIKKIQIEKGFKSRGDTLEYILDQATQNIGETVDIDGYGKHDHKECYVELKKKKFEDTTPYRSHYLLTGKKEFLLHAICHGVTILNAFEIGQPSPAISDDKIEPAATPTDSLPSAVNDDDKKNPTDNALTKNAGKKKKS